MQEIIRKQGGACTVGWFTQTKNKRARILTGAPWLMQHALLPEHWADRWPEWWQHIVTFTADGKAEHDDAEDAFTGLYDVMTTPRTPKAKIRPRADRRTLHPSF